MRVYLNARFRVPELKKQIIGFPNVTEAADKR